MFFVMGTGAREMVLRPDARDIYRSLEQYCLRLREQHPELVLISGIAEGWDEAIAKVGLRQGIPYHIHLPNPGYGAYYWQRHSLLKRDRSAEFQQLVAGAAKVITVSQSLYLPDGTHANIARNESMVAACHLALVYEAGSSGTRDAVRRLRTANKPFVCYPFS